MHTTEAIQDALSAQHSALAATLRDLRNLSEITPGATSFIQDPYYLAVSAAFGATGTALEALYAANAVQRAARLATELATGHAARV